MREHARAYLCQSGGTGVRRDAPARAMVRLASVRINSFSDQSTDEWSLYAVFVDSRQMQKWACKHDANADERQKL